METVDTSKRLSKLRELMKEHKVDLYVVPSEDSHKSEFIAPCDARREYISGFSGSSGCAVIALEKAALATDGRYFNQAEKQLDPNWTLLKQGMEDVPTWQDWTTEQAEGGKTVGVDPTLLSAPVARRLAKSIKDKSGGQLVGVAENLIDIVWGSDRPPRSTEEVIVLEEKYAGKSIAEKLEDLRKELDKKKCAGFVVSMLDDIAWLFNLRGKDIPYNPVFFSYATVTPTSTALYVDQAKLTDEARSHLGDEVSIRPYETIFSDLKALKESAPDPQDDKASVKRKFAISGTASWALSLELGGEDKVDEIRSPISGAKTIKNATELAGMRACHVRDGAALSEFFAWLEDVIVVQKKPLDEVQAADKLEAIRKEKDHFVGLSFPTISSTGPNAAVIHYQPEKGSCSGIDPNSVYLCDSGAQYFDGTTDTTRTLHFGTPTEMEIKSYTLVLKGVIALDTTIFPKGTSGYALDAFARQFLWRQGLNYRHGTGHGVGSFLNVHEGPIGIGTGRSYADVQLSAGNVISDEPGYYEDSKFGIRIENVIMARETTDLPHSFGDKPWLCFEHVTMVPMCQKLIDKTLLTADERTWLNNYHQEVWEKTEGHFAGTSDGSGDGADALGRRWLWRETRPL